MLIKPRRPATHNPDHVGGQHNRAQSGAEPAVERDFNGLVYVLSGRGAVGPVRHPIHQGKLGALGPGPDHVTEAEAQGSNPARDGGTAFGRQADS